MPSELIRRHSSGGLHGLRHLVGAEPPPVRPGSAPTRRPFRATLCETETVRVILNFHPSPEFSGRLLQFRSPGDKIAWRYNEARVQCQHDGRECVPTDSPKTQSMSQCKPCPCHPVASPNFAVMGFGYVQLMLNKVLQSCEGRVSTDRYRLLMIGLGGGSFTQPVRRRCHAHIDVIEKQKDVADAARLFLGYEEQPKWVGKREEDERVIIADGQDGLQLAETYSNGRRYDAIAIDCMVSGKIPPGCRSEAFVNSAARLLSPGGVITQWSWQADFKLLRTQWRTRFHNVTHEIYSGNPVLEIRSHRRPPRPSR